MCSTLLFINYHLKVSEAHRENRIKHHKNCPKNKQKPNIFIIVCICM
uniref:Uncharacterized protein n=1 Tax=Anguilla anguilla TaxID=7936 RepID=A0A0E9WH18_ANGAN